MTLDEAILHAEEVADKCALTDGNIQCENDHRQLAEWLGNYKRLLEQEPIDKSAMMQEIYMEGVNMGGEYQGCWVRFKDIETIVDKYMEG